MNGSSGPVKSESEGTSGRFWEVEQGQGVAGGRKKGGKEAWNRLADGPAHGRGRWRSERERKERGRGRAAGSVRLTGRAALARGERRERVVIGIVARLIAGLGLERHLLERLGRLERGAGRSAGRVVCGQMQMVEDLADNGRVRDQSQNLHGLGALGTF